MPITKAAVISQMMPAFGITPMTKPLPRLAAM